MVKDMLREMVLNTKMVRKMVVEMVAKRICPSIWSIPKCVCKLGTHLTPQVRQVYEWPTNRRPR